MNFQITDGRHRISRFVPTLPVAWHERGYGEVRLYWRPIPSCPYDRAFAERWEGGRLVSTLLVQCIGKLVYRERATGRAVLYTPALEAEIQGRLVPAPRSSRSGEAVSP